MNFEPTPEQRVLSELAAGLAEEAGPALLASGARFAEDAHAALGARGLFRTRATVDAALVVVELSRVHTALGAAFASGYLFIDALRRYGAANGDAPPVLAAAEAGALVGAVAFPAPGAASGNALSTAEAGGAVVLSGTSTTRAVLPVAGHLVVAATGGAGGAALVSVAASANGVRHGAPSTALSLGELPRGSLDFHFVRLSPGAVLATGQAARAAERALGSAGRILSAAVSVGVARRALERAVSHARAAGKLPQSTEFAVSDLATSYDAAFLTTVHAAWQRDQGAEGAPESAAAKLLAGRAATEICHAALAVCGESGYGDDLGRAYLDARHLELYDGTEADQIDVIASNMLGES